MINRGKYLVGSFIVLLAIAFLMLQGLKGTMVTYLNVRELSTSGISWLNKPVQVTGIVVPGSVKEASEGNQLFFVLQDVEQTSVRLKVFFQGIAPDNFKPGIQVVVQGTLGKEGVFQAERLLVKCPSKYEAK